MQKCGKGGLDFSPLLGFINGAAPELCGSERVRQPWKEEGEEGERERYLKWPTHPRG